MISSSNQAFPDLLLYRKVRPNSWRLSVDVKAATFDFGGRQLFDAADIGAAL